MKIINIENEYVTDYLHKEKYENGYGHGTGDTKVIPYIRKIKPISQSIAAYTPNECEQPNMDMLNAMIPGQSMKVEGQLRMIYAKRVYNVRDIGGWLCTGGHMAYGKVIRGAELGGLKDTTRDDVNADIESLTKVVGITTELDIRGSSEYSKSPLGVKLLTGKTYGMGGYASFFTSGAAIKSILTAIVEEAEKGGCTYVHCAQGADRTGLVCMIIEALCGCSEDSIIKDWELTGFCDYLNTKYISDSINSTKKEWGLRDVMVTLYNDYGGKQGKSINDQVYSFITGKCGVSAALVERLRKVMISKDDAVVPNPDPEPSKKETVTKTIVIKDLDKVGGSYKYQVTDENGKTTTAKSNTDFGILALGKYNNEDSTMVTDYIPCKGYTEIEADYRFYSVFECYDANKKPIYCEAIKGDTGKTVRAVFAIPSGACYIRYLMIKHQGFSATLRKTETSDPTVTPPPIAAPMTIGIKDMKWSPFYISTGLGRATDNTDRNFKYFELGKEYFGHTLSVSAPTNDRQWSILRKVPSKAGEAVQIADGFEIYEGKAFTRYAGKTYGTDTIVIPDLPTNGDKLYVFIWCGSDTEKTIVSIK